MGFISFHSPVGDLSIAENDNLIVSIDWGWGSLEEKTPLLEEAKNQIAAYFNGKLFPLVRQNPIPNSPK